MWFHTTEQNALNFVEVKLQELQGSKSFGRGKNVYFVESSPSDSYGIEDDHIPFLRKG